MSRKLNESARADEPSSSMTEDELQEMYKDDPSPLIQAALAARRENLRIDGRLKTLDEILAEVREDRGVSARDDD